MDLIGVLASLASHSQTCPTSPTRQTPHKLVDLFWGGGLVGDFFVFGVGDEVFLGVRSFVVGVGGVVGWFCGGFGVGGAWEFFEFYVFAVGLGVAFFAGLGGAILLTAVLGAAEWALGAAEMALGLLELAAEIFAHSVDAAFEHERLIQQIANEYQ